MRCRGRASTRKLLQFPSRLTDAWKPPMQEAHGQLHVSVAALLAPANELFAAASKLQALSFDGRDENPASSSSLSPMIGLARARLSDLGPLCMRASLHQGIPRASSLRPATLRFAEMRWCHPPPTVAPTCAVPAHRRLGIRPLRQRFARLGLKPFSPLFCHRLALYADVGGGLDVRGLEPPVGHSIAP
ncbi:hypothetical protein L1887_55966 [Cichorium endivia]|nr:hypothetical protein L1887_55966 [Cichorium endivia]